MARKTGKEPETRAQGGKDGQAPGAAGASESDKHSQVTWDDSKMASNFADVVNIHTSQEQVNLFFGTNQTWNPAPGTRVKVELHNRIILTPLAAKRMWSALGRALKEYEDRFGELKI